MSPKSLSPSLPPTLSPSLPLFIFLPVSPSHSPFCYIYPSQPLRMMKNMWYFKRYILNGYKKRCFLFSLQSSSQHQSGLLPLQHKRVVGGPKVCLRLAQHLVGQRLPAASVLVTRTAFPLVHSILTISYLLRTCAPQTLWVNILQLRDSLGKPLGFYCLCFYNNIFRLVHLPYLIEVIFCKELSTL